VKISVKGVVMDTSSIFLREGVERPREFIGEYKFYLRDIPVEITVRLYKSFNGKGVMFEQSHFINTPSQIDEYRTSRPWNDNEKIALDQAVSGLLRFYNMAVSEGHLPDESWLARNESFK